MSEVLVSESVYDFYGPKYRCAYCGDRADTIDHTVPKWFVAGNMGAIAKYRFIKVSACRECNTLLGGIVDKTFYARKRRLEKKVVRRGSILLKTALWTDEDLNELGRGIKPYIKAAKKDSESLVRRISFLRDPGWPQDVPDDLWHVIAMPEAARLPSTAFPSGFRANAPPTPRTGFCVERKKHLAISP